MPLLKKPVIENIEDLCAHFNADKPSDLNRCISNDSKSATWIAVRWQSDIARSDDDFLWNQLDTDPEQRRTLVGFCIGTTDSSYQEEFKFPIPAYKVDDWIESMAKLIEKDEDYALDWGIAIDMAATSGDED